MENNDLTTIGSLAQWKAANGIGKIEVLQGKGAAFAYTEKGLLLFSKKVDFNLPLWIGVNGEGQLFCYNQNAEIKKVTTV